MASSHPVGLALFFMFLVASGSGESSGLVRNFQSDNMEPTECSWRPTFPFFKDALSLPSDADEHPYLKLTLTRLTDTRKNSSDLDLLRIFVWPDTGNCNISGQLTNGVMRRNLTFIVETAQYERGLCMTATQEVPPMGNQSVWTLEPSRLEINSSETYNVTLEGNGTIAEWHTATWLVIGAYIVFCSLFFLIWYLLVFPGTCLPKAASSNPERLRQRVLTDEQQTCRRLAKLNSLGVGDKECGKTTLTWKMMITTSVLYFLPSLQFTLRQSRLYLIDGNQDHCFFNFACLKPGLATGLWMWNHILSNVGYMFLGLLFLVITFVKENVVLRRKLKQMNLKPTREGCWPRILELRSQVSKAQVTRTGTCPSFSLFYTMGLTLFMIGLMSSCYHLCPTNVNFQFDTTYMYLLAIFMSINLFKSRHPDLSPDATAAFTLLAVSVFMGVLSVYMDIDVQNYLLDVLFFLAFVWGCATFAVVFYGVDSVDRNATVDLSNTKNFQWIHKAGWKILYLWVPRLFTHIRDNAKLEFKSKTRFWFLVIFMTVNTVLSMLLLLISATDFPSVLLFIFLTNVAMYLTFYLVMKYLTGERLTWPTLIFLVLSGVFMLPAMYFFKSEVKSTVAGAALSKEFNQPCFEGLNYFDNHDVWHFLSSFGLFFSLSFLLTLDDDIAERDQENIQVW